MASGIVKTSNNLQVEDIILLDWDVEYNSQQYVEVSLIFNTDMSQIVSDYNANTSGSSGGVFIDFKKSGKFYRMDFKEYQTDHTLINTFPQNNKIVYKWLYSDHLSTLIETGSYKLEIIINEGLIFQLIFETDDIISNNDTNEPLKVIQSIVNPSLTPILNLYNNFSFSASYYYIDNNDSLLFRAKNGTDGLAVTNVSSINNYSVELPYISTSGRSFESTSFFDANINTGLSDSDVYIIDNNSIECDIVKADVTLNYFSSLVCESSTSFDGYDLSESSTSSYVYTLNIPIFNDVNSKNVTIQMGTFQYGTSFIDLDINEIINFINGEATFTLNYPQIL